ncbi:hypothetical protein LTR95_002273 [Oleoguttula sp. CCFEE 5521]
MVLKIDVHTHALPDFFEEILGKLGPAESGVPQISWSMDATRRSMAELDIGASMLSLSAPGSRIAPDRDGARSLAKRFNEWAAEETKADPSRIGFFAAVPGLQDTDGCLAEIRYAFDELKADAAHMIMTGTKRRYPDVKVILAHGGGTLPLLSKRLAILESRLFLKELDAHSPKTFDEIIEDARSFYFDLALCGTANVLDSLLLWAPEGHVLYGSDFPYATVEAEYNTRRLEAYDIGMEERERYYAGNSLVGFPRLQAEAPYRLASRRGMSQSS